MALREHLDLRGSQRCRWDQLLLQDTSVETFHQLRGCCIVNFPHTCHHARRARVHEAARMKSNAVAWNHDEDLLGNLQLWREYGTGLRQGGSLIISATYPTPARFSREPFRSRIMLRHGSQPAYSNIRARQ